MHEHWAVPPRAKKNQQTTMGIMHKGWSSSNQILTAVNQGKTKFLSHTQWEAPPREKGNQQNAALGSPIHLGLQNKLIQGAVNYIESNRSDTYYSGTKLSHKKE